MNSRRVRVEFMCFMIIVKLVIFAKVVGCQQFRTREVVNIRTYKSCLDRILTFKTE